MRQFPHLYPRYGNIVALEGADHQFNYANLFTEVLTSVQLVRPHGIHTVERGAVAPRHCLQAILPVLDTSTAWWGNAVSKVLSPGEVAVRLAPLAHVTLALLATACNFHHEHVQLRQSSLEVRRTPVPAEEEATCTGDWWLGKLGVMRTTFKVPRWDAETDSLGCTRHHNGTRSRRRSKSWRRRDAAAHRSCSSLTHGIVHYMCLCGVTHCVQTLKGGEGPSCVFNWLYRHFPDVGSLSTSL